MQSPPQGDARIPVPNPTCLRLPEFTDDVFFPPEPLHHKSLRRRPPKRPPGSGRQPLADVPIPSPLPIARQRHGAVLGIGGGGGHVVREPAAITKLQLLDRWFASCASPPAFTRTPATIVNIGCCGYWSRGNTTQISEWVLSTRTHRPNSGNFDSVRRRGIRRLYRLR